MEPSGQRAEESVAGVWTRASGGHLFCEQGGTEIEPVQNLSPCQPFSTGLQACLVHRVMTLETGAISTPQRSSRVSRSQDHLESPSSSLKSPQIMTKVLAYFVFPTVAPHVAAGQRSRLQIC